MSNVDINVDRRTDRQKIGRLYRTLLQAGAIISKIVAGDIPFSLYYFTVKNNDMHFVWIVCLADDSN